MSVYQAKGRDIMSQEGPEGTPGGQSGGGEPAGGPYGPWSGEQWSGEQWPGEQWPGEQWPGEQWPGEQTPGTSPGQQNGSPFAHQNGSPFAQQNGSPFLHPNGSAAAHPNGSAAAGPYAALPDSADAYPGADQRTGVPVPGPAGYGPREQSGDRAWATAAYLTPFVVSFLGPLIIYVLKRNESRFVRHHAAQALNMMLTATICSVILLGLGAGAAIAGHDALLVLAFVLWLALVCVYLVFLIVATVAANRGAEPYRAPGWLCWRVIR